METIVEQTIAETIVSDEGLDSRVQSGAAKLDLVVPGWADKIHLEFFSIRCYYTCVLGQLYGDYDVGLDKFYGTNPDRQTWHVDGFCIDFAHENEDDWDTLQQNWEKAIKDRKTRGRS